MAVAIIEAGGTTPRDIQIDFYSGIYNSGAKSDSPERSRVSLMRRARQYFAKLGPEAVVLDLGSGPQILERQYFQAYGRPNFKVATVDLANIRKGRLLAGKSHRVIHHRADGMQLPFVNESFDGSISNMALDFMPSHAVGELFRVLKPGTYAFINLHHPALIPQNLDELIAMRKKSKTEGQVLSYWEFLRRNHVLTSDPKEIESRFRVFGFTLVGDVRELGDGRDRWWEIDIYKPKNNFWQFLARSVVRSGGKHESS